MSSSQREMYFQGLAHLVFGRVGFAVDVEFWVQIFGSLSTTVALKLTR